MRLATSKDLDALVDMQVEFEKYFQNTNCCEKYKINKISRRKDILALNFSKNHIARTLIAEVNGEIVGRISFYKGYWAEVPPYWGFRLSGLFVHEKYRKMGISKMLFEALTKIAKKEKMKTISWSVWGQNVPAVRFYENLGGKYYSREHDEHYMFYDVN